ncbi:MAG TPA: VWA domain-containing protein [Vicinamibacterales bacterium]|nr:VWA domain-containing protein [Vicinamibacterales bacterium]
MIVLAAIELAATKQDQPRFHHVPASAFRLDVVVVDRTGHAVPDLRAEDFEIREDGTRRTITGAEFRRPAAPVPLAGETDETTANAARLPGTRVFAFFLDELNTSATNADLVRRTITSFIDEKLEARDLVGVMKPFDAAGSVRFSRDRAFAHGVIASFEGRKENVRPRTRHEATVLAAATGSGGGTAQIVKAGLRDLTMRLGGFHADRPVLVVFSEGFQAQADALRTPLQDLGGLLRAASRFHITTFTFDPTSVTNADAATGQETANRKTLSWLASETGGRAVTRDQFIYGVARLFHDTEAFYALTYEPAEPDGRRHQLDVRVKRRGASVLTHPGRWAMRESDWQKIVELPGGAALARDRALRRSPLIDAWVGMRRGRGSGARLTITWEPRRPRGGSASIVGVKARGAGGETLFDRQVGPLGEGTGSTGDVATFVAPPGRVDVDLTILDSEGTALDTDVRYIDVPELRVSTDDPPVLLPVWIVATATSRALQTAIADGEAAPAASRTFSRLQQLLIRVPVFDPGGEGTRVTLTLRNQQDVEMRGIDPLGASHDGVTDFALPLVGLAPAEYWLEVRAENRRGTASERVSFRLIG